MKNKIAITIQNFVQFYSVKPFLDLKDKYDIDIYVPMAKNDTTGFNDMFNDIYEHLKKSGYKVFRKSNKNIKYKILLEPYPMDIYLTFNHDYRIKYKYSAISAKPALVYKMETNIVYDAILCHSTYERDLLSNYSKTYLVGKLNYFEYKKHNKKVKKKTLLYLPTYGDLNSINDIAKALSSLKDEYNIITKEHHGTNYLHEENDKSKKLASCIDKFYDSSYPLDKLLEISDVVLSDNSGSIFEAFYSRTPVCIFSKNMKDCSLGKIDSLQYTLVKKDIIPFTNKISEIKKIVTSALSKKYIDKQLKESAYLFPIGQEEILKSFENVIDLYLHDKVEEDRMNLHRILSDSVIEMNNNARARVEQNTILKNQVQALTTERNILLEEKNMISDEFMKYRNGRLHRLADKIYKLKGRKR